MRVMRSAGVGRAGAIAARGRRAWRSAVVIAIAIEAGLPASAVRASDGVIEINQAAAIAGGVTAGDAPGLPVSLGTSGSYRLTGPLTVASGATTAIVISSSFVTLDLGGFEIRGPVECFGAPASCPAPQSGVGVEASSVGQVTVRNGLVRGMGGAGLSLGESARVEDVTAISNGGPGIRVGAYSQVRDSIAQSNGGDGIGGDTAQSVIVDGCTAVGNVLSGIRVESGSMVLDSQGFANGVHGLHFASQPGLFRNSMLRVNQGQSVSGGTGVGGNVCDDLRCSRRAHRRFYRTPQFVTAPSAPSACQAGFHMASFWELSLASLEYVPAPVGAANLGSGVGPPNDPGWVRPGVDANANTCSRWTTTSGTGTIAALTLPSSSDAASNVSPWGVSTTACSQPLPVWCVED